MKQTRGFTLLELLVAIGIFALVSTIAYGSLIRLLEDRNKLEAEHAFWRNLSLTFARMEEDFSQARNRPVRDISGITLPPFRGQRNDTRVTGAPTVEFTRGGVATFGIEARSDLQRAGYRLSEGSLRRLIWPVLDRAPQTEVLELTLLKDIEDFHVRFYDANMKLQEEWPPSGIIDPLPRGVEVKITFTDKREFTRVFIVNG